MPRLRSLFSVSASLALLTVGSASAAAAIVGSDAAVCQAGRPSILVHIVGLKVASGTVSAALYAPEGYLEKGGKLRKIEVPVRSLAPVDICVEVPRPGRYAIAVHHDLNGNGKKDRNDGGGYSRNPRLGIFNLKPAFRYTGFDVGQSPRQISVQLMYVNGLTIGPVRN